VFIFDNVLGTFGGSGIAAAMTARTINGWRSYVGQTSRPNDATYFITFNQPQLSSELAERCVVINIGAPKHGVAFVAWATDYVRRYRLNLIADALAMLRGERMDLPAGMEDRWQAWTRDVLCRCPGGVEAAQALKDRRPAVDAESEDREQWQTFLSALALENGSEVSAALIHEKAVAAGLWQPDKGKSATHDRQTMAKWMERLLAGTGAVEAVALASGAKRMISEGNIRSRAYRITRPDSDPNIPI
jgi:hypothetical protein